MGQQGWRSVGQHEAIPGDGHGGGGGDLINFTRKCVHDIKQGNIDIHFDTVLNIFLQSAYTQKHYTTLEQNNSKTHLKLSFQLFNFHSKS